MDNEIDERAAIIEDMRKQTTLLGQFLLTNAGDAVLFELAPVNRGAGEFDKETFAACMVQLMATFMMENPDTKPAELMIAINTAVMGMAAQ